MEYLEIIPEKQTLIDHPTDELVNNISFLYSSSPDNPSLALGKVVIFIIYILTGLQADTIEDGTIKPETDKLLVDFMVRHHQYLSQQSQRLLAMATKN